MNFSKKLRKLIEEREITQKDVAKHLNLAPSTISSYVQGVREPDFATLILIADFFQVSIDYLLDHPTANAPGRNDEELLRIFHSLTNDQQHICIEQARVLLNATKKEL